MKTLFDECVEALFPNVEILSEDMSTKVARNMINIFPFSKYGRVEWSDVNDKKEIVNQEVIKSLVDISEDIYIIWDDASCRVIKSNLKVVLENIDDVVAVSFDTWLMQVEGKYVIEYHHNGNINIAYPSSSSGV